jgi:NADH dehydrogenase [ubiquinone] 1 alpha subcomplex assembly factor 1
MNASVARFDTPDSVADWYAIDDAVMGGVSASQMAYDADGHAVFSGAVSLANNGGFASVRSPVTTPASDGASAYLLTVRGDGKRYKFSVRTGPPTLTVSPTRPDFNHPPASGPLVRLALADFVPTWRGRVLANAPTLLPSRVQQLGLLIADRQAGHFPSGNTHHRGQRLGHLIAATPSIIGVTKMLSRPSTPVVGLAAPMLLIAAAFLATPVFAKGLQPGEVTTSGSITGINQFDTDLDHSGSFHWAGVQIGGNVTRQFTPQVAAGFSLRYDYQDWNWDKPSGLRRPGAVVATERAAGRPEPLLRHCTRLAAGLQPERRMERRIRRQSQRLAELWRAADRHPDFFSGSRARLRPGRFSPDRRKQGFPLRARQLEDHRPPAAGQPATGRTRGAAPVWNWPTHFPSAGKSAAAAPTARIASV